MPKLAPAGRVVPVSVLVLAMVALAGCNGDGGDGDAPPGDDGPAYSLSTTPLPPMTEGFAVLLVEGRLRGEGPSEPGAAPCTPPPADGEVDVAAKAAWAKPGSHSFRNDTWLVVLDRVVVEDPRGNCVVPAKATAFDFEGAWVPQLETEPFRLEILREGDDLMASKTPIAPGGSFETSLTVEDGAYTFSGNVTLTHAGWWPMDSFEEKDGEPGEGHAAWWTDAA